MGEKIIGKVKWFSNRAGYGFISPSSENSPTTEDVFVHQSNIVVDDGTYRTLDEGYEVEFEIVTEESGKLRSMNVTAVGGGPVVPSGGNRRRRRKAEKGDEDEKGEEEEKGDEAKEEEVPPEESKETKEEAKQGNNKRRNRGRGRNKNKENKDETNENGGEKREGDEQPKEEGKEGSKEAVGGESKAKKNNNKRRGRSKKGERKAPESAEDAEGDGDKENGDNGKGEDKKKRKVKRFDDGFSDKVKEMVKKKVDIRQPFCLVSVGDSRVKLGSEGYAALAHSSGIVGEGTFLCDEDGLVKFTWQNVLVAEKDTWKVSDPVSSAANGAIIASFKWEDDNVGSVKRDETTETFWGSDKADLRELFEKNSFQMRKVFLDRGPPRRNRRRNKDKKKPDEARNDDAEVEDDDEKEAKETNDESGADQDVTST